MEETREEVPKDLELLIRKAEENSMFLYCIHDDIWFSPEELKEQNAVGKYCWNKYNWKLISPFDKLAELFEKVVKAKREYRQWEIRVNSLQKGE